jgi:hypothetical protein
MDNLNTNIMHETQNGDKNNKKTAWTTPKQVESEPRCSWMINSVFCWGGGISDKLTAILLIGMYNASVVWSFLLNRDKTISYFFYSIMQLDKSYIIFSVVWRIVARM